MKSRTYFTLVVKEQVKGGWRWSPQFGDYDRAFVEAEFDDHREHWTPKSHMKIIETGELQADIDAKVAELNAELRGGCNSNG